MRRFTRLLVLALCVSAAAVAQSRESPSGKYGAPPTDACTCPVTHPIKGNFTTYSGERCIYRLPGGLRDSAMSKEFPLDGLNSPRTKKVLGTTPTQPGVPTPADFGRRQLRGDQSGLARPPRTTASDADVARNTQAPDRRV